MFDTPEELAFSGIVSGFPDGTETGSISGLINIPADAMTGATRMRVSMQQGAYPPACGSFPLGEVEDYTVNISAGSGTSISLSSCPQDISETPAPGQTGMTISWNAPTANSSCMPNTVNISQTSGPASGSNFSIGTTTISYELSDDCGNQTTCTFAVTA